MRPFALAAAALLLATPLGALELKETPYFAEKVADGDLPPIADRAPKEPLVPDIEARGRTLGQQGGGIRTFIGRAKDVRYMVVYGYARLVGYTEAFELKADLLASVEEKEGARRKISLVLIP